MHKSISIILMVLSTLTSAATNATHFHQRAPAGSWIQKSLKINTQSALKETIVREAHASFIKLHFNNRNLHPEDIVSIESLDGQEKYTYTGQALPEWAMSISSDTIKISITPFAQSNQFRALEIDKISKGFEKNVPLSTCGVNQRTDTICYKESHPTEYALRKPVAKLLLDYGTTSCTSWRLGKKRHMITNDHCLSSQDEVDGAEIWFNYENTLCNENSVNYKRLVKVFADQFIQSNYELDYALYTHQIDQRVQQFGYLTLSKNLPTVREPILIPQHGAGSPKQFGLESDVDDNHFCQINAVFTDGLGTAPTDTGYQCDTIGGSSGSPVISRNTHEVIALHHLGGCQAYSSGMNSGVRSQEIYSEIHHLIEEGMP